MQPVRGYGNAYRAGFAAARGEVIATGDADCSYPFYALPDLLRRLDEDRLDFLSGNRLHRENRRAMKPSHFVANLLLTGLSRRFFRSPFRDSQSGMWVFRVRSGNTSTYERRAWRSHKRSSMRRISRDSVAAKHLSTTGSVAGRSNSMRYAMRSET